MERKLGAPGGRDPGSQHRKGSKMTFPQPAQGSPSKSPRSPLGAPPPPPRAPSPCVLIFRCV
eukprot:12272125-Alexandrium_andersonii.AAC.1